MSFHPDHYPGYDELTDWLRSAADDHPDRLELRRLGTTPEDRALWLAAVTDRATGEAPSDLHLDLEIGGDLEVVEGVRHRRIEHLDGQANVTQPHHSAFTWRGETRCRIATYDWVVRGAGTARIAWFGDRIGRHEDEVELDNCRTDTPD